MTWRGSRSSESAASIRDRRLFQDPRLDLLQSTSFLDLLLSTHAQRPEGDDGGARFSILVGRRGRMHKQRRSKERIPVSCRPFADVVERGEVLAGLALAWPRGNRSLAEQGRIAKKKSFRGLTTVTSDSVGERVRSGKRTEAWVSQTEVGCDVWRREFFLCASEKSRRMWEVRRAAGRTSARELRNSLVGGGPGYL